MHVSKNIMYIITPHSTIRPIGMLHSQSHDIIEPLSLPENIKSELVIGIVLSIINCKDWKKSLTTWLGLEDFHPWIFDL